MVLLAPNCSLLAAVCCLEHDEREKMIISNLASRLLRPFANAGAKATIPVSQTDATRASYEQGFPALNMTPIAAGGVPPSGQDFNGILYDLSNAALWQQAAGILPWDAGFAQSPVSGGYPKNALVVHNAVLYQSSVDNNTETPGAGTNWQGVGVSNASQPQHAVTLGQMHDVQAGYMPKSALELSSVPSQKVAPVIVVTQPHLRVMVWNGTRYVRAPWHQPCQLFFSYDNPASISGALPVRGDVSYQQANYPDLVERLGLSGSGTFTLAEARGEFIRVLDNGRGVDTYRAVRTFQDGTAFVGSLGQISIPPTFGTFVTDADSVWAATTFMQTAVQVVSSVLGASYYKVRPRNVAYPLWITY